MQFLKQTIEPHHRQRCRIHQIVGGFILLVAIVLMPARIAVAKNAGGFAQAFRQKDSQRAVEVRGEPEIAAQFVLQIGL